MWYVINSEKEASLISGFNQDVDKEDYIRALEEGKLKDLLNFEKTNAGDVFFMPAGRVHAIGAGILLAEIQQTSDVTYRIYDWDRKDENGKGRELHTELALDVIDFRGSNNTKTQYKKEKNQTVQLAECKYFTTNLMHFDTRVEKDYNFIDSFVIYMCPEGKVTITWDEDKEVSLNSGETVLVPAEIKNLVLTPEVESRLLEVYIKDDKKEE
jgi:mannose-6-phosphate isomerase